MSHISGSKMRIQEWFSPLERAHNLLKISHFLLRSPNLMLGHVLPNYINPDTILPTGTSLNRSEYRISKGGKGVQVMVKF